MTSFQIPIELSLPRSFVLDPIINAEQAYAQAGAYKSRVFGLDLIKLIRRSKTTIEARLLERRLVPFWHIQCQSHFDYSRLNNYQIAPHHPDAIKITLQGPNQQALDFRVDQTGRSASYVALTGIERCLTRRDKTVWIDSYIQQEEVAPGDWEKQQQRMQKYVLQRPQLVEDLEAFASTLTVQGQQLFQDGIQTIVVPPLETADNVVRRSLKEVMVSIDAPTIHEAYLKVGKIDLYFRPLYVFEFEKLDEHGNALERKLEELDALNREHWTNLATTEFQMSKLPWAKILRLSADIGNILLQDVPIAGTAFKITGKILDQGPDILDDMRGSQG